MECVSHNYDDIPIRRSYEREVLQRLEFMRGVSVEKIGEARYGPHRYPLVLAQYPLSRDPKKSTVLLSAGVHGDEPAPVHALLDFLRNGARSFGGRCNFVVFPCMNPSGFEADMRGTMAGHNVNRLFGTGSYQGEVCAIERWLKKNNAHSCLAMDLHEDAPDAVDDASRGERSPRSCYLYETMPDVRRRIGRSLIAALPGNVEVCQRQEIYGDVNDRGVISPEGCRNPVFLRGTTFDAYLQKQGYAEHALVTETPTVWPMEKRVFVQRLWVRKALELVLAG